MHTEFWWENSMESNYLKDLDEAVRLMKEYICCRKNLLVGFFVLVTLRF
jgi:hypothetical protein